MSSSRFSTSDIFHMKTSGAPAGKRARSSGHVDQSRPKDGRTMVEISRVVHVRHLSPRATEADLVEALSHFGGVSYVSCMHDRGMALVEFEVMFFST